MDDSRRDSVNKNKRSKTDQITNAVSTYLQKRNYPEYTPREVSEGRIELSLLVDREVSRSNSILYTCYKSDPIIVDHSFSKFITWLKELHSKSKEYQDLDTIVAPLFCHLYFELLQKTHEENDIPANFFKFHLPTVEKINSDDTLKTLINAILTDSCEHANLKQMFRSNKYKVHLSGKSIAMLKKYLSESSHVVLLQVLQTWFSLDEGDAWDSDTERMEAKDRINGYSLLQSVNGSSGIALRKVFEVIGYLKNEPPPFYSVHVGNIKDEIDCGILSRELGIAVYSTRNSIRITSIITLKQLDYTNEVGDVCLHEHSDRLYDLSLMKINRFLVSASGDKTIKLFDLKNYSLVNTYKGHNYPVYRVSTSPNCCYIISGSYDNSCRLWSTENTDTLRLYAGHTEEVTAVAFHPNSMYFVTGSADKNIRMWTINDSNPVRLFLGSKGTIYALAFSSNGKYLATAGEDKRIRVWDILTGKQISEIKVGGEPIIKLAWSHDHSVICSGALDGSIKKWEFNFGQCNSNNSDAGQHRCLNSLTLNAKLLDLEYAFDTFASLSAQNMVHVVT